MSNIEQDCVTFRMRDEDGNELHFKVSMGIKLQKVFDVYASKKCLTVSSLKFTFNGDRVIGDTTPELLGEEKEKDKMNRGRERMICFVCVCVCVFLCVCV